MADTFRTNLSKSGQLCLYRESSAQRVDAALAAAWPNAGALPLQGISFSLRYIHFGRAPYPKNSGAGWHQHEQIQFEYALSGAFAFSTPQKASLLKAGDGLLFLPRQMHSWTCRRTGIMLGGMIDLTGPRSKELLELLTEKAPWGMTPFGNPTIATSLQQLLPLLGAEASAPWSTERAGHLLGVWMAEVLLAAWPLALWGQGSSVHDRETALSRRATEFMAANCTSPIRLQDVALEVGISVRHLNRIYQRCCGESPGAALIRFRLEQARESLLREPDVPVKTIAYRYAFSSPAHFTTSYRRHFGETPLQTRCMPHSQ